MNPERKIIIPEPPAPVGITPGNLLSSVAPPIELPNFVTAPLPMAQPAETVISAAQNIQQCQTNALTQPVPPVSVPSTEPDTPETFSPVIPLSKGEPTLPIRSPEDSQATQSMESLPASTPEIEKIGDIMPGSGLFTWVKGAVSVGGILHRVAEKAKSSVDSMITTLDPQMKEYLNSGGDVNIVITSEDDDEISPIREAFQTVFGKATVVGFSPTKDANVAQSVGYAAAYAAAMQRIADLRSVRADINNNVPILAVESFLNEAIADRWYELSLLVLCQSSLGVELHVVSQGTGVEPAAVTAARAVTPPPPGGDSAPASRRHHDRCGISLHTLMADNLQVANSAWHEAATGVSRKDILHLAACSLAGSYKRILAISTAQANDSYYSKITCS